MSTIIDRDPPSSDGPTALMPVLDAILDKAGASSDYDTDKKTSALTAAIQSFEGVTHRVFFPRDADDVIRHRDCGPLELPHDDVTAVASITRDGDTLDLTDLLIDDDELSFNGAGLSPGIYHVIYTHGIDPCPDDVARAIALLASSMLVDGPWDSRGFAVDDGTGMMRLLTAGVSGAQFSIPEVEACAERYRLPWAGGTRS